MFKKFFILLLLLCAAGSAWASNDWKDTNITTDWFDPTNWTMGYVPISTDGLEVILYRTGQAPGPIISGEDAVAYKVQVSGAKDWIGGPNQPVQTLTVQSGASLTTTDYLYVGGNGTSKRWGDLINAGTINVGNNFLVGGGGAGGSGSDLRGWLHMTGGTINVNSGTFSIARYLNASGFAYLWGGTINANYFTMKQIGGTGTALLDIMNDGKLIVNGDITGTLTTYCTTNGWITGYGNKNNVRWDTTTNPGKTTVWAVNSAKATSPSPANGATNVAKTITLSWTAGPGIVSHDVYLGTALNDVNSAERLLGDINGDGIVDFNDVSLLSQAWLADPIGSEPYAGVDDNNNVDFLDYALLSQDWMNNAGPIFKGNQLATNYDPLGLLALGITYYWRIDEVSGPNTVRGDIWSFTIQTGKAFNPNPASGASNVETIATLSWSAGFGETSHDVYFGTTYPPEARGNQIGATFDPGTLAQLTTYYWRIDEKTDSNITTTGDDWSFTTRGPALMRKGPYLIYPGNNTQMTVLWQLDSTDNCSIEWGADTTYSAGNTATTEYGIDHQHKYNITGLTPGTKYYYRVTVGGVQYTGSFLAAPDADAANLKFFMYGDTRTNPSWHDSVCARMIATYTADPAYQTIALHSGDWVERGIESYQTSQWWTYSYTNLMDNVKSIAYAGCIGNHEDDGSVWAKYWPFPFVASPRYYYSFDYGPVHVTVLDQFTTYTNLSAQYTWLVNDLSASTKPWKIIVLHQPGWSAGSYHANNTTVQSTIQPLCVQYGVQIVVAGDNHYYSRADVNGVQHLTSGAGGAPLYTPEPNQPNIVTYSYGLSFQKVEITDVNTLTCDTIKVSDGTVIDTFTLNR